MERCPICNARYTGKKRCVRCKNEMEKFCKIEDMAAVCIKKAGDSFTAGDYRQMYENAERACALRRTEESAKMLACAALLTKKFDTAYNQWKDITR